MKQPFVNDHTVFDRYLIWCALRAYNLQMIDDNQQELLSQLQELRTEHRDLDAVIAQAAESPVFNQLQLQRLKKRKLLLKDQISKLESRLHPDIIA